MTTTEQIQQLNNAVSALQTQVSALSNSLSSETNRINLHIVDSDAEIALFNSKASLLDNEDIELHEEIHDLAEVVSSNVSRVNSLEVETADQRLDIQNLETTDSNLQQQIDDMDVEHHEELHSLADTLSNHASRINGLEIFKAETPEHVVLSESEYDEMAEHDYNTFYFVYEED